LCRGLGGTSMRLRVKRAKATLALVAVGGIALGNGVGACASLGTESLAGAVDFCFIFDCTNGFFGGLVDPCSPIFSKPNTPGFIGSDSDEAPNTDTENGRDLFSDCPEPLGP